MQLQTINQSTNPTWQQEFRTALKTQPEINSYFNLDHFDQLPFDMLIPLKFAQKIKKDGVHSARWKQFVPSPTELELGGLIDPIGDKRNLKESGIIHRYNNRILYTPTSNCPVICRYCFRKNELSNETEIFKSNLSKLVTYLISHPEVDEVILTGGDPLMLSTPKIETILETLKNQKIK